MISSYSDDYKKYINDYVMYCKKNNYLLIWCDYERKITYVYYDDIKLKIDYILTSTNLILKMLDEKED